MADRARMAAVHGWQTAVPGPLLGSCLRFCSDVVDDQCQPHGHPCTRGCAWHATKLCRQDEAGNARNSVQVRSAEIYATTSRLREQQQWPCRRCRQWPRLLLQLVALPIFPWNA